MQTPDAPAANDGAGEDGDNRRTHPPVSSPFVGKTLEDCADYLQQTEGGNTWNMDYFCVLFDGDVVENTMTLVHVSCHGPVQAFSCPTEECSKNLCTSLSAFEEKFNMHDDTAWTEDRRNGPEGKPYKYTTTYGWTIEADESFGTGRWYRVPWKAWKAWKEKKTW